MNVEAIGICASVFILASMLPKSTSTKGNIVMRGYNLIGSLCFVVYGLFVPAWSTAGMNLALAVVNAYHLIKLIKEDRQNGKK